MRLPASLHRPVWTRHSSKVGSAFPSVEITVAGVEAHYRPPGRARRGIDLVGRRRRQRDVEASGRAIGGRAASRRAEDEQHRSRAGDPRRARNRASLVQTLDHPSRPAKSLIRLPNLSRPIG